MINTQQILKYSDTIFKKIKLNFLKRILIDTVEEDVRNYFFNIGFPSKEIMIKEISKTIDPKRLEGLDWPKRAHTMIGLKRLDNLHNSLDQIREKNIQGDFIETGVWRGGACIFTKMYFDIYGMNKKVYVADSFEGLPKPDTEKYPQDIGDEHFKQDFLKVSLEEVKHNFKSYRCLDSNVFFIKGWFSDTLKNIDIDISLLRFDGDMYGSTMDVLNNLYEKVQKNVRKRRSDKRHQKTELL